MGEHRIRDLNDEINKDLREKCYWEDQIKSLGGADYKAKKMQEVETYGAELASHTGYKYRLRQCSAGRKSYFMNLPTQSQWILYIRVI